MAFCVTDDICIKYSIPFHFLRFDFVSIQSTVKQWMFSVSQTDRRTDGRTDMLNMHCFGSVINIYLLVVLALWIWSKWTKKLTKQMVLMSLGCLKPQFKAVVWDRKKKQNHVRWYLEHQPTIYLERCIKRHRYLLHRSTNVIENIIQNWWLTIVQFHCGKTDSLRPDTNDIPSTYLWSV